MDERDDNIDEIVDQVIQSPQLRTNLENAIRNIRSSASSETSATITSPPHIEPAQSVRRELQRIFPSIRRSSNSYSNNSTPKNKRKKAVTDKNFYHRDVILLKDPYASNTLKGLNKSVAFDKGFGVSNVQFNCEWTFEQIVESMKNLFKHLGETHFEILVPIGGRLVKPSLSPGVQLDGINMKSIFHQKVVYIRPLTILFTNESENENLEENISRSNDEIITIDEPEPLRNVNDDENHTRNSIAEIQMTNTLEDHVYETELKLAIENSLMDSEISSEEVSLETMIRNLNCKINEEQISQFNIFREDIFKCCVRAMRRKSFCAFNKISVRFSDLEGNSEGAVDLGGPTREMFRLVINTIKNSRLFFGEEKKYLRFDMDAVANRDYYEAGRLISLSVIHTGQGPHFFSKSFYSILTCGITDEFPSIDDIENEFRGKIDKLNNITEFNELQEYLSEEPMFVIAGYQFIRKLDDKGKLLKDVVQFYGFHRLRLALEQFKEGLETGEILQLIQRHPNQFKDIMCNDKITTTACVLEKLFKVEFSESGSSKRIKENRAISFWRDFLLECEDNETDISLEDILIFCTGADAIPLLGFQFTPRIIFEHDASLYPKANTCGLQLHLPTIHSTYEVFKFHCLFGIGNCKDFGFA